MAPRRRVPHAPAPHRPRSARPRASRRPAPPPRAPTSSAARTRCPRRSTVRPRGARHGRTGHPVRDREQPSSEITGREGIGAGSGTDPLGRGDHPPERVSSRRTGPRCGCA
ncbi:hypothetical protein FVA95_07190 [Pseudonocardia sp. EV170527-09]|nr:hypothetical protein FVA95_07190 [Pseudonocardia sp. EV170527-09]